MKHGSKRGRWLGGQRALLPRTAGDKLGSSRSLLELGRTAGRARAAGWRRHAGRCLAMLAALVFALHVTSGGVLSTLSVPVMSSGSSAAAAAQLEDLVQLSGDGDPAAAAQRYVATDTAPKLIPRIIHQTYKTGAVPERVAQFMRTWVAANPGWDVRFYDDHDCLDFVKREFPEYLDAYRRLSKDVERSDFFRYMVILRVGGVYADIDTECKRPLDAIIRSRDTLIVGWENEFGDAQKAVDAWHVRTRQLLQWVFAAAPGHPALKEVCDHIANSMQTTFSADTHLDTLERTGPGVFTDVILKHAALHAPHKRDDPWTVRVLPRVQFGAPRSPAYGLSPNDPSVVVLHHALASWRIQRRWFWQRSTVEDTSKQLTHSWKWQSSEAKQQQVAKLRKIDAAAAVYPVSVVFEPAFDMFTHLVGAGERQSGWDVSAALTTHGSWQPSVQPSRRPSLADAVVGSLGISPDAVLVDVGAGYGFFSLAAAARGHRVHAFELAPASLDALEASIDYNGFKHLIEVHKLPLGAPSQEEYICIVPRHKPAGVGASAAAAAAYTEMLRGYSTPVAHQTAAFDCQLMAKRTPGASVLGADEAVGALRVSANGWEGFILEGFEPLLARPRAPPVVAVEWNPAAMRAAGYADPLAMVHRLYKLGYTDVSHSGYVCDERWYAVTYGVRRRGGVTPEDLAALKQPTWCRLLPEHFGLLLERASSTYPETLLFVNKAAARAFNESSGSGSSSGGATADRRSRLGRFWGAGEPPGPPSEGGGGGAWSMFRIFSRQAQGAQDPEEQQQQHDEAATAGAALAAAAAEDADAWEEATRQVAAPLPPRIGQQQQQQQQHHRHPSLRQELMDAAHAAARFAAAAGHWGPGPSSHPVPLDAPRGSQR